MLKSPKIYSNWNSRQFCIMVVLLLTANLIVAACVTPYTAPVLPISPLIPGNNETLANNRWRIVEVIYEGEPVKFDATQPIYISFDPVGTLNIFADCPGGAYLIEAQDENHYKLTSGMFSAVQCKDEVTTQFDNVLSALKTTTEYKFQNEQLLLIGRDTKIALEMDNPR